MLETRLKEIKAAMKAQGINGWVQRTESTGNKYVKCGKKIEYIDLMRAVGSQECEVYPDKQGGFRIYPILDLEKAGAAAKLKAKNQIQDAIVVVVFDEKRKKYRVTPIDRDGWVSFPVKLREPGAMYKVAVLKEATGGSWVAVGELTRLDKKLKVVGA